MHVDHVVAVRGAEVEQDDLHAAKLDLHSVFENLRRDGPALLPQDVGQDVHVPDTDRRVDEDVYLADVSLVIVGFATCRRERPSTNTC